MTLKMNKYMIGDLGKVNTGSTPSTKRPEFYGGAYPFITPTDINNDARFIQPERYLSEKGYDDQKTRLLPTGSVCFLCVCIGATIGKVCMTKKPSFTNQQINSIIVDKSRFDNFYVYYLLCTLTDKIKSIAGGAATPIVNKTVFSNVEVRIPPLTSQRKIASILSAYDDLTENNLHRIKILEEMAQMIYREWFVHFRFPGYEKVKMVDSPLGKIPEGWEVLVAPKCLVISPSIRVDKNTIKPFVNMGGLSDNSMIVEQTDIRKGSNGSKFQKGDTLFARITPCLENGKTGFVQFLYDKEVGLGSTEFIVLRSINLNPEFVYLLARTEDFRNNAIKSMSGASGRQRVRNECFDKYLLAKPENDIIDKFTNTVKPMFKKIYQLSLKNKNLRKTRDLLLPKLIRGEIDVERLIINDNGTK